MIWLNEQALISVFLHLNYYQDFIRICKKLDAMQKATTEIILELKVVLTKLEIKINIFCDSYTNDK